MQMTGGETCEEYTKKLAILHDLHNSPKKPLAS